jgi:hypothetical protein
LLHSRLEESGLGGLVPERVGVSFAQSHTATLARNVLLLSEAAALCDRLDRRGIPTMLLKGIALLRGVYPHPALRPMFDVDILVHKRDLPAVRQIILSECGYKGADLMSADMDELLCRTAFVKPEAPSHLGKLFVEVHWSIFPVERPLEEMRLPLASFWRGAEETRLDGQRALVPSSGDHLCYIAAHNCGHDFDRLIGLVDLAYLLPRVESEGNWGALVRCARRYGCRVSVFLNLGLLAGLFGLTIPVELIRELAPSTPRARVLAGMARRETVLSANMSSRQRRLMKLACADGLGDTLRYLIWMLFPPRGWLAFGAAAGGSPAGGKGAKGYLLLLVRRAKNAVVRLLGRTARKS